VRDNPQRRHAHDLHPAVATARAGGNRPRSRTSHAPKADRTNITSRDGTTFAVDTTGQGAPLILIGSAFNDRATVAVLANMMASQAQDLRWSQSVATP
ncbi:hypothetical protein ACFU8W_35990, partial [Streptomyces sp. NPDC057565]